MNTFTIKAFGITRDILGGKEVVLTMNGQTVGDLRQYLLGQYPNLKGLRSLFIAVNNAYAEDGKALLATDEIALIPPVAGG
ncbi:MAG: MoaD/ThiS family protein [Cyclobacteriaceae bacterium]|nr:MoaD/ThiS family protein [Cyclobacteriaceae bacterium]